MKYRQKQKQYYRNQVARRQQQNMWQKRIKLPDINAEVKNCENCEVYSYANNVVYMDACGILLTCIHVYFVLKCIHVMILPAIGVKC